MRALRDIHVARRFAFIAGTVAVALGCVSGGAGMAGTRVDRNVLVGAELREQHYNTVYDAVEALRSTWFQARGPDSFTTPSLVLVYFDNVRLGGVERLREVDLAVIERVEHFDGTSATARWGVGHGAGVILLTSIANTPRTSPPQAHLYAVSADSSARAWNQMLGGDILITATKQTLAHAGRGEMMRIRRAALAQLSSVTACAAVRMPSGGRAAPGADDYLLAANADGRLLCTCVASGFVGTMFGPCAVGLPSGAVSS